MAASTEFVPFLCFTWKRDITASARRVPPTFAKRLLCIQVDRGDDTQGRIDVAAAAKRRQTLAMLLAFPSLSPGSEPGERDCGSRSRDGHGGVAGHVDQFGIFPTVRGVRRTSRDRAACIRRLTSGTSNRALGSPRPLPFVYLKE